MHRAMLWAVPTSCTPMSPSRTAHLVVDLGFAYTDAFKAERVKRLVGPSAMSAAALARQVGVSQPTLSQWLREARRVAASVGLVPAPSFLWASARAPGPLEV
ncbi:transposase [Myxococcus sp. AB036A]|uniref:transposase n=1 Tax=Myxococcus sp. AB036A TaxID=2562793 RepID=UPI001146557B